MLAVISAEFFFFPHKRHLPLNLSGAPSREMSLTLWKPLVWTTSHHRPTVLWWNLQSSTGTQLLAPASTASSAMRAWKPLPGTSLSAVQYSTVRNTTDRVGLSFVLHKLPNPLPCRARGQRTALQRWVFGAAWLHTLLYWMNINTMFT